MTTLKQFVTCSPTAAKRLKMAAGRTRKDLESDRTFELALTRLIEIVGEASTRLSEDFQSRHRHIPWPYIRGMRNRLIHGYDAVDKQVLWDTVKDDLPPLIAQLEQILKE